MPDIASLSQELMRGLDPGAVLALRPHPAVGFGLMAVGLALCLVGYWLYRLMVALACGVIGGALAYLLMPVFNVEGVALCSAVVGAMLVLFVVGWFLYAVAVFLVGAFSGLVLGAAFWLLAAERFTSLADLPGLTIAPGDLPAQAASTVLPAAALGLLALRWERGAVTLVTVVLGGFALVLGLRYSQLSGPLGDWGAAAASLLVVLGLYLGFRSGGRRRPESGD